MQCAFIGYDGSNLEARTMVSGVRALAVLRSAEGLHDIDLGRPLL
jgi:hypothetical protein